MEEHRRPNCSLVRPPRRLLSICGSKASGAIAVHLVWREKVGEMRAHELARTVTEVAGVNIAVPDFKPVLGGELR